MQTRFSFENLKRKLRIARSRWEDNNKMNGVRRCGLDSSGSALGPVTGSYEHSNEPFGNIKGGEFLD